MDNKIILPSVFIGCILIGVFIAAKTSKIKNATAKDIIFIGDSHAIGIASKIPNAKADPLLSKVGWSLNSLIKAFKNYDINKNVRYVFISIGTNEGFTSSDKIEYFVDLLKNKFPNALFYIFKGSYGWSGKYENHNASNDLISFYQRFSDSGVNVLQNGLGYFPSDSKAHSLNSIQVEKIVEEIKYIINNY
jgi:hypothetical protein